MDTATALSKARQETLTKLESAAKRGDTPGLLELADQLRRIEGLSKQNSELEATVNSLVNGTLEPAFSQDSTAKTRKSRDLQLPAIGSPRDHAETRRHEFVEDLAQKGINLRAYRGTIYKCVDGQSLAIPYATERRQNRWFLGIPTNSCDRTILLCEARDGLIAPIYLNERFFKEYGNSLSDAKGQWKFNVLRRDNSFFLSIPEHGSIDVDNRRNNFEGLAG